jgi:hypothetical protein
MQRINKVEAKQLVMKKLDEKSLSIKRERVETICRAIINRLSYEFVIGDDCLFLNNKKGRQIFIESNPNTERQDGYGTKAFVRAGQEAIEVLDEVIDYEAVRSYRSAV